EADFARAPGLLRHPCDHLRVVFGVTGGQDFGGALGPVHAARIVNCDSVSARSPVQRVGRLKPGPPGISQFAEANPKQAHEEHRRGVGCDVLAIQRRGEDYRKWSLSRWAEYIRPQRHAIPHRDRRVAFKDHLLANVLQVTHPHGDPLAGSRLRASSKKLLLTLKL